MKIKSTNLLSLMFTLSAPVLADNVNSEEIYDWTGVYLGAFLGGAANSRTNTSGPIAPNGQSIFNKPYNYDTDASLIGGGTIGYNWQITKTPLLLGLEGEYGYLGMSGSIPGPNNPSPGLISVTHSTKIGGSYGYGVVGARLGYAHDRRLFYVKSGAVFTSTQTNFDVSIPSVAASLNTSGNGNDVGYAIGAGVEQALPFEWFELANNITIKLEYLYLGIGRTQTSAGNLDVNNAPLAVITTTDHISGIHTAKLGINYKF